MSACCNNNRRVPLWMTAIIILVSLPALILPAYVLMSAGGAIAEAKKMFLWLFPFYLIVAGFLTWQCYGRRTVMSWILLALMVMTDAAMMMLMSME